MVGSSSFLRMYTLPQSPHKGFGKPKWSSRAGRLALCCIGICTFATYRHSLSCTLCIVAAIYTVSFLPPCTVTHALVPFSILSYRGLDVCLCCDCGVSQLCVKRESYVYAIQPSPGWLHGYLHREIICFLLVDCNLLACGGLS